MYFYLVEFAGESGMVYFSFSYDWIESKNKSFEKLILKKKTDESNLGLDRL